MKFHDFTERAQEEIDAAERAARALNHTYIGTEHLLLGIIQRGSGVVVETLRIFDIDAEKVREEIEKLVHPGPVTDSTNQKLRFTPRSLRAIHLAWMEATLWNRGHVDSEHLFLGLVRQGDGVAAMVLRNLGLSLEKLGPAVFRLRLEQMKIVERIVRPVPANVPRKRKMREELLAHLTAIYGEEHARLHNSEAALHAAARRLGEPAELSQQLEQSLPTGERWAHPLLAIFNGEPPNRRRDIASGSEST